MKTTAALLSAVLSVTGSAQAMTVSAKVGPMLKQVQRLIAAKNYKAAAAKLDEAEAVKSSPDDETVINQLRLTIAASSLGPAQPHCTSAAMGITNCDGRPAIGAHTK